MAHTNPQANRRPRDRERRGSADRRGGRGPPARALLREALPGATTPNAEPRPHDARPGDRPLLCSDGLSTVVPGPRIRTLLTETRSRTDTVLAPVAEANGARGPDDVSCVVADAVEK
ncbi:hypothetical protein BM536_024545 [Streptomyces phaeoluteigriseus]|uniref:PPM-type phosphatase domain-containing protein n=1 Tax=Streptomyces phaeoluteigriseus TaxID=114686 RepID=A0A1V6MRS2_9ACTN|nr:hypothetical protein [Streptomyces phaeoluteigriseus]OQD54996.1 hypothetical protein BM536_024545 [Streptomyces phaeoluteigriseus]